MTTWALDLDGVIWTGTEPIAGSAKAVGRLLDAGHEVVFVTNNAASTIQQQEDKLASFGIDAAGRVTTSAMGGAALAKPGDRILCMGGPGISEAAANRGCDVVEEYRDGDKVPDAILVGLDPKLSYDRLRGAVQAVLAGARFLATNNDPTYPTEQGLFPGAGAIVGAIAAATGQTPEIGGKPYQPQADLVRAKYGSNGVMVGDRPDTDGLFARSLGYEFLLVLSGVTSEADLPTDPAADAVGLNLASHVDRALADL